MQFELTVFHITTGTVEGGTVSVALTFVRNKSSINCAYDTCSSGELVERITVALLTKVMHEQKTNIQFVRQLLEQPNFIVVVCVRGIDIVVAYDLKSIDGNKDRIGMLFHKITNLFAQSVR